MYCRQNRKNEVIMTSRKSDQKSGEAKLGTLQHMMSSNLN